MTTDPELVPVAQALALALKFHETYERLAPSFGYETRTETRAFDPESANGRLMIAVCGEVCADHARIVAEARRTANYWKAELVEANKELDANKRHAEQVVLALHAEATTFKQRAEQAEASLSECRAELAALRARVEAAPEAILSRSDVDAWSLPESWSGKRVRLLAVPEGSE